MSDAVSLMLVIKLVAEGIGVAKEVADLAKRVERGEVISQEEVDKAREEAKKAKKDWEGSGEKPGD